MTQMNGFPAGTQVKVWCKKAEFPHEATRDLLLMVLTEAGYPTTVEWDAFKECYVNRPPVPDDVLQKARKLVLDELDIPYVLVSP